MAMSQEQVESFIREKRDKGNKDWAEIAKDLAKAGYVSPRTGKPVVANTVRYIYYYGFKAQHGPSAAAGGNKVTMIKEILKLKSDDKTKVNLINQILDSDS